MSARAASVAPLVISDATALAVVGLTPRQFRAFVREYGIPHVLFRRRMLVRTVQLLDALDRLSGAECQPRTSSLDEDTVVAMAARPRRRGGGAA